MMPGISGYDVLISLKNDPRIPEIPVIMISALTELNSIVRCIEAGADDYLAKPFDPLLRARVGSSLEKKHLRDREREMVEALRIEKERSEQLLLNILPKEIVTRLNGGETVIADQLSECNDSVLRSRRLHQAFVQAFGRGFGSSHERDCFRSLIGWRLASGSRRSRRSETPTWWRAACPKRARTTRMPWPTWRWR